MSATHCESPARLDFKPNLGAVLPRLRALFERRATDRICAVFYPPSPALDRFAAAHGEGFCPCPGWPARADFWSELLAERAALDDDSVPSAYLSEMDQGLYGGLLGGAAQFLSHPENGWISSMVAPLLADWDQFDHLRFDPSNQWFDRYRGLLAALKEAAGGRFGLSHFIAINGLNFAFELVGATKAYLGVEECPERVEQALQLGLAVNLLVQKWFFADVPLLAGGTCSNMTEWIPGQIVSESVDPFHMTSVAYFERWGRPALERLLSHFDGGVVHLHGNGRHLLEAVCAVPAIKAIYLGDDKGFAPAIEVLGTLRRRAGDMPLVTSVSWACFNEKLAARALPGGVLYKVTNAPDAATANRLMDQVRAYRADS